MKKIYILLVILAFHSYFCHAQDNEGSDRVESIKMAYITKELNLSPQEAQRFWPVYNDYQGEIQQARGRYANDEVAFEQKVVEIKTRYQGNFRKVLGNDNQRTNRLFNADKNYNGMLRKELHSRQSLRNREPLQNDRKPENNPRANQNNSKINQQNNPRLNQQNNQKLNQQRIKQQQNTPVRRKPNNQRN